MHGLPGSTDPIVTLPADGNATETRLSVLVTLCLFAVMLIALGLRLWHLEFQSLWWDEGVSIYLSGAGLRALTIGKNFSIDLHPPGYYVLLAGWRSFLGPSVFSDRLLSVFWGVVTIPLAYIFGRKCTSSRLSGLIAGLLVALSPIDVYYSQESRMYSMLPAFALVTLIISARIVEKDNSRDWALWILVNAVSMYVYYYLGMLTAAEALVLLAVSWHRRSLGRWFFAQILTLALYVPWFYLMAEHLNSGTLALPPATVVHLTPLTYLQENWNDFTIGYTAPPAAKLALVAFGVAVLAGIVTLGRRRPLLLALLLLGALVPLAGAGAVLLVRPFFFSRFIIFAAIPIWLLAATGITADRRLWPASIVILTLILGGNVWTDYHERTTPRTGYAPDDYRTVFTTLAKAARPGDTVVCGYPWQVGYVEAYLWNKDLHPLFLPGRVNVQQILRHVGPTGHVWVYSYSPNHQFEGNWAENDLAKIDKTVVVDQYGDSRVRLFAPTSPAVESLRSRATFGGKIALISGTVSTGNRGSVTTFHPGDQLNVALRWRSLASVKGNFTVFVHVLGPDQKIWGQHDSPPLHGAFPTGSWNAGEELIDRYAITLSPNAPTGEYRIEVGMYVPSSGQRLVVGPSPQPNNQVLIGSITVDRAN